MDDIKRPSALPTNPTATAPVVPQRTSIPINLADETTPSVLPTTLDSAPQTSSIPVTVTDNAPANSNQDSFQVPVSSTTPDMAADNPEQIAASDSFTETAASSPTPTPAPVPSPPAEPFVQAEPQSQPSPEPIYHETPQSDPLLDSDKTAGIVSNAPVTSAPHKKSHGAAILVAVFFALALIGGAGYAYWQNQKNNPDPAPQSSTTETKPKVVPATAEDVDKTSKDIDKSLGNVNDTTDYQEADLSDTTLGL